MIEKVYRHKRILLFTTILIVVSFSIAISSMVLIYKNAEKELYDRLTDIVNREKSTISTWIENYKASEKDVINHLKLVRKNVSIGKTGEVAIARELKDTVEFIICKKAINTTFKIAEKLPLASSMHLALAGKTGYRKGIDYDGVEVFAAYSNIKELNWGIVAKISSQEIYEPYIKTSIIVLVLTVVFVSICSFCFFKLTNPLIKNALESQEKLLLVNQNLKLAKEKAEENENRYKLIFNSTGTSNSIFDTQGILGLQNELSKKTLGKGENGGIGQTVFQLFGQEIGAKVLERMNRVLDTGISEVFETEFNLSTGMNWFRSTYQPIFDACNKVISIQVISQNITEIKNAEKELIKAKEKAEESDRLKTSFLQNMSHEIRTPLNAIAGFSAMLNKPELSTEKRNSFVAVIQSSSKQLISIVSDILTISSLETKQEKLTITNVCINSIIVDLLSVFKSHALNQNISLYVQQHLNDKQSEIYSDKTKINQILTNLLTNAFKFTHQGFVEFGYHLKENELEFFVKDSGIGIKSEFHEKIFERFRQADKSINKLYGGTGLGLAISKSFTELLGGKIWVESEPEKGATFYFTIPYEPVNEIDKVVISPQEIEKIKTVLVAEDEEYNFLFIEELLIEMDFKIIHAKNGNEVIEFFKANPNIDLILMDIKMPILDGHQAAKIIKKSNPNMPIIGQSAYALEHERAKYEGIFDDYLTKPIDEEELKRKIRKYINA